MKFPCGVISPGRVYARALTSVKSALCQLGRVHHAPGGLHVHCVYITYTLHIGVLLCTQVQTLINQAHAIQSGAPASINPAPIIIFVSQHQIKSGTLYILKLVIICLH